MTTEKLQLEGDKYTLVYDKDGSFSCLRYGQQWRDLTGDKLVYLLMQRVLDLEKEVRQRDRLLALPAVTLSDLERDKELLDFLETKGSINTSFELLSIEIHNGNEDEIAIGYDNLRELLTALKAREGEGDA